MIIAHLVDFVLSIAVLLMAWSIWTASKSLTSMSDALLELVREQDELRRLVEKKLGQNAPPNGKRH